MSAFASLILLIGIVVLSMSLVAYSNYKVEYNKRINLQLEKMKIRAEELEDVVLVLDSICETRVIPKLINDEIIQNYETMMDLNSKASYLQASMANAQSRAQELSIESPERELSRICKSDAQIARYQTYLREALNIIHKQHSEGKISGGELNNFSLEINWLQLQINVITHIAEGHKAYNKQEIMTANSFYKKAQTELMRSNHPDERKHKMINQVADILFGRRKFLDEDLMPETEFNPPLQNANLEDTDKELDELPSEVEIAFGKHLDDSNHAAL